MISITSDTETVTIAESIADTDNGAITPRVSRSATLDGGCVISSSGCSHSDRTIVVKTTRTPTSQSDILRRMAMQAALLQLANTEGVFTGYISQYENKNGNLDITFLIKEKLTTD